MSTKTRGADHDLLLGSGGALLVSGFCLACAINQFLRAELIWGSIMALPGLGAAIMGYTGLRFFWKDWAKGER